MSRLPSGDLGSMPLRPVDSVPSGTGAIPNPPAFPFGGEGVCDNCFHWSTDATYVGTLSPGPTGVLCGACLDERLTLWP